MSVNLILILQLTLQALLSSSQGTRFNYGQQYVLIPVPHFHQEQQVNNN